MANPNMSPATAIADDNPLLFNHTRKPEIQKVSSVIDLPDECTARATSYPFTLSFNNLTYSVKIRKTLALPFRWNIGNLCSQGNGNTKVLLDDVSGEARQGEIMAIMGASGAGKTTLIDALAGRIEKECLKGTVTLNGEVLKSKLLKSISAYVMQEDILYPFLNVEETLMFSAEFRLPRSLSKIKKQARVQALIDQLGLQSVAKTLIGDEQHRGVSLGERRRVSIGIEIIHEPILLFLDEPISGLDSTSAFKFMKFLQGIAKSGRIVIMSIHQPSHRILRLLDRLIFLSHGLNVCNEKTGNLPHFFAEFGYPIPENENQSEFALDLIRELDEAPGGISSLVEFNKSWQLTQNSNKVCNGRSVQLNDAIQASIFQGKLVSAGAARDDSNSTSSLQTFPISFWIEIMVISKRLIKKSSRMPERFAVRLLTTVTTGFILATVYWQFDDSPSGTRGRLQFSAFGITCIFYICSSEISLYLEDRKLYIRETANNSYRLSSYLLAHTLVSIPYMIILSLVYAAMTFWTVGLAGGFVSGFLFYFITVFATFWAGSSFMAFVSGLVSSVTIGFVIVASFVGNFLLFSGFYISRDQMHWYWLWFHYISLVKYPFQGIMQNEFSDSTKCFMNGVQFFEDTAFVKLPTSVKIKLLESMGNVLGTNITSSTCLVTGAQILEHRGVTDISKWNCFWILVAFGFLFRILFYFAYLFRIKHKRK